MFSIVRTGENRLDIEFDGRLDAAGMKAVLEELVVKSADIRHGRMLYDIVDFHLPTLGAVGVELSSLPSMLRLMNQFDRAAVLTDKQWLRRVSELEGILYPGLEIKAFERDQRAQAEAWLAS